MKKLLSLVLSAIISISLVGCANTDNTDNEDTAEDKIVNEEVIKEEDKTSENEDATDTKETSNTGDDGYYRDEDGTPMIKKYGSELGEKPWNKDDEPEEHPDSYYEDNTDDSNGNSNYKGNAMDSEDGVIYQYKDDDGNTVKEYENGDIVTEYND